jgi:hypothetical protein
MRGLTASLSYLLAALVATVSAAGDAARCARGWRGSAS